MDPTLLAAVFMGMVSTTPVHATERAYSPPQHQRLTSCTQRATASDLQGQARQNYINQCLKNRTSLPGDKSLTPRQQAEKRCRAGEGLSGANPRLADDCAR